jgi:hypothetical protein
MNAPAPVTVQKLDHGYLVSDFVFPEEAIAGCTSLEDLFEWMTRHFEQEPHKAMVEAVEAETDPEPVQEPKPAPPPPVAAPEPDEPPPDAPAPKPDPIDVEKAEQRQTIDRQAIQLVGHLDKLGASKKWVKASYTDISILLNVTAPTVQQIVAHTKEKFTNLRVVRVMAGEHRGNNFTFNADLPEPDAPTKAEPVKPKENANGGTVPVYDAAEIEKRPVPDGSYENLTRSQRAVFDHIVRCAEKNGSRFQIELKTLAEKAGIPQKLIHAAVGTLKERRLVNIEWQSGNAPFITLLHQEHA